MTNMTYDYEYIDMDDYEGKEVPINQFKEWLEQVIQSAQEKRGTNLRISVDCDSDIELVFDRPKNKRELQSERERELRNKQAETERLFHQQEQKWETLRNLAAELGVKINE